MAQISEEQRLALILWATPVKAIDALWLFGSRSRDEGRPDSDYDIAVELAPAISASDDRPFTAYFFGHETWKDQIKAALNAEISLVAYRPEWTDTKFDPRVIELWRRD